MLYSTIFIYEIVLHGYNMLGKYRDGIHNI